jgi:hypothetical protein
VVGANGGLSSAGHTAPTGRMAAQLGEANYTFAGVTGDPWPDATCSASIAKVIVEVESEDWAG